MTELDRTVEAVFRTPATHAMRLAVSLPLVGSAAAKTAAKSVGSLVYRWRSRVKALAADEAVRALWLRDAANVSYAGNCPPYGVRVAHPSRVCGRPLVCPFCYARRYVGWTHAALDGAAAAFGSYPLRLRVDDDETSFEGDFGQTLPAAVAWFRGARALDASDRRPGATVSRFWFNRFSRLHGRRVAFRFDANGEAVDDAWALARLVGRRLRLPPTFMTSSPAEAAALLQGLYRCRMTASYGLPTIAQLSPEGEKSL